MSKKPIKLDKPIVKAIVKEGDEPETPMVEQPTGSKFEDVTRPQELRGSTYEIKSPADTHSTFVTINDIKRDKIYRPYEIFIHSKNTEHIQWVTALTSLLSTIFKHEMNYHFVIQELLEVEDPKNGSYFVQGVRMPSNVAHIGTIIMQHIEDMNAKNCENTTC